jgi:hypothetical protein
VTITLGSWAIPVGITALLWLWAVWPREPSYTGGYFDFDLGGVFRFFVGVAGTLLIWLVYFATRFFLG